MVGFGFRGPCFIRILVLEVSVPVLDYSIASAVADVRNLITSYRYKFV